jgi:hypothetical protein
MNIAGTTRDGQSLIETCLAMLVICVVFAGLMQISQIFAAREILQHAAMRGARAKTVGFNQWMVKKVVRVASIPNAGKMLTPQFDNTDASLERLIATNTPGGLWMSVLGRNPSSIQYNIEKGRIPNYLASDNEAGSSSILDYEDWDTIHENIDASALGSDSDALSPPLHVRIEQDYPLWVHWHEAFYDANTLALKADSYLENHYPLYLNDMGW